LIVDKKAVSLYIKLNMKKLIMKKILAVFLLAFVFTSCYNNRVLVGNVNPNDPVVKVQKVWNSHLICGLIPIAKTNIKASEFVKNNANYVVKTNISFVNGLIQYITWGIYTPTTTTFYLPVEDFKLK